MKRHLLAALLATTAFLMGCDTSELLDDPAAKKTASSTTASGSIGVTSQTPTPVPDEDLAIGADVSDQVDVQMESWYQSPPSKPYYTDFTFKNKTKRTVNVLLDLEATDVPTHGGFIGGGQFQAFTATKSFKLDPLAAMGTGFEETNTWKVKAKHATIVK